MSGEVIAPIEVHVHDSASPFAPIDHEVPVDAQRPADGTVEVGPEQEPEPVQLPGETPLAEMFVDLVGIGCRFLDPDQELSDLERTNLKQASAALERRYAPWLENKADAILWARFGVTVAMVATPRVKAWRERKLLEEQDAAKDRDSDRSAGVRQDLAPREAPDSADE